MWSHCSPCFLLDVLKCVHGTLRVTVRSISESVTFLDWTLYSLKLVHISLWLKKTWSQLSYSHVIYVFNLNPSSHSVRFFGYSSVIWITKHTNSFFHEFDIPAFWLSHARIWWTCFLYWILEMFFKLDWSSDFYISWVYNWRLQFNGSEVVWDTGILTKTFLDKYDNQLYLSSQLRINNESTEDLYKNNLVIINSFLLCIKEKTAVKRNIITCPRTDMRGVKLELRIPPLVHGPHHHITWTLILATAFIYGLFN